MESLLQHENVQSITYKGFKNAFAVISHIFFREIKTTDAHLVPPSGPCIFIVGPHANQFVDGIVFVSNSPRSTYAIMAAVSYDKPVIGHVGKILNAIRVVRPQDIVNIGTGKIIYDGGHEIRGENTKFTTELGVRDFIIFGRNYKVHVSKIISDTSLEITHTIHVKENIQQAYEFKIAPHVDQTPVYEKVNERLNKGECIVIFPEGGSHDRSEMLPLKAGFAVMALGAAAANPDLDIKIVPVGLNYFHPDRFRSRAVVSYGQPLSINKADVEKYKLGGKEKREAVTKLLDMSDEAFKSVTVNAPDYDTLMVIQAVRRLYRPKRATIEQVVQLNRQLVSLWAKLKNENNDLNVIIRKVKYYNDMLAFFGIRDHQVEKLNITTMRAAYQLVKRVTKLVVMAGLGAPALISNLPLIWITLFISKRKQKEALAGSSIKIDGKDVLATWKVIVAAFAAPALYGIYALLFLVYLVKHKPNLTLKSKLTRASLLWAIQPVLHYLLMRLGDTGFDIYKSIKPLFLAIRNPEAGEVLRSMRHDLSNDITTFIDKHVPDVDNGQAVESDDEVQEQQLNVEDISSSGSQSPFTPDNTTTTEDESISRDTESFLELSFTTNSEQYNVESILLDEEGEGDEEEPFISTPPPPL